MRFLVALVLMAGFARADGERAGEFDYYVMALSWSPTWCALEGDARNSPQCDASADFGWVLHGLWPQYEKGWPSYCPTNERNPSRADTRDESDLFGTSGSAISVTSSVEARGASDCVQLATTPASAIAIRVALYVIVITILHQQLELYPAHNHYQLQPSKGNSLFSLP